jgi:hypothetical protein
MATEIGTLVAKFTADTASFDAGNKRVASGMKATATQAQAFSNVFQNALTRINPQLGQLATGFSTVTTAATSATVAIGAASAGLILLATGVGTTAVGLWKLANAAAEAGGHLKDLSQQTNFSVRTLSALKVIASTSGSELDSISNSLVIFQKNLQAASQGNEQLGATFKQLDVTSTDNEAALRQVFTGLMKVKDATAQTNLAMESFGTRGGKAMLGMIKESGGSLDEVIAKLQKWGLIVSEEDAAAADLFSDKLEELQLRLSGVARVVGAETLPAFTAFFLTIEAALDANKTNWKSWGETIAHAILSAEALMGGFVNVLRNIDWTNLIPGFGLGKVGVDFFKGADKTAEELMKHYNRLVNPTVGGDVGTGIIPRAMPRAAPTNKTTKKVSGEPDTVAGWNKALEMLQRLTDKMKDEAKEFDEAMERVSRSVSDAIVDQAFAVKALEAHTPNWLQQADEFIRAKTAEGYAWDEDTKRIYLNNAARLQGLTQRRRFANDVVTHDLGGGSVQFSGEGTRPRRVGDASRPRIATDMERAVREQYQEHIENIHRLAGDLTNTIDRAIYDGFQGGIKKGFQSLLLSLLNMIQNVMLTQLQNAIAGALGGVSGGGKGGFWAGLGKSVLGAFGVGFGGGGATATGGLGGAFAGKFASGGNIGMGQWGIVGSERVYATPAGAMVVPSGGGETSGNTYHITVNVPVRGGASYSTPKSRRQIGEDVAAALQGAIS